MFRTQQTIDMRIVVKIQDRLEHHRTASEGERFHPYNHALTIVKVNLPSYISDFKLDQNDVINFTDNQLDDLIFSVVDNIHKQWGLNTVAKASVASQQDEPQVDEPQENNESWSVFNCGIL